jgi:hypothetical protein
MLFAILQFNRNVMIVFILSHNVLNTSKRTKERIVTLQLVTALTSTWLNFGKVNVNDNIIINVLFRK